ncbi:MULTISPECIES: recombination mediator RecR [Bacteroidota]|uniref:Recombination protein RecR n=1 Tax=Flectobacillus rivi TaxID=2984209 RepID=A0ABT6Z4H8_9BACT|nr:MULTISPECIES: recombination mediator RecR [Bacteroidota]MDI9876033.1 recombination mediator RecR [Flectobacillus rivi]NBB27875.1 recombination protein RecR [Cellulophaga sp. BC115SP]
MNYPSKLIEQAIDEIAKLPGIGKKSALRMALHLLKRDEKHTLKLAEAIVAMRTQIRYCEQCHNISDTEICGICASKKREASLVCVVEDARDVLAIENTSQYRGLYHVLGGIISPLEGVGPADLKIESLINRITTSQNTENPITEIILGLSPTMEGDTTAFYLTKRIKPFGVKITTIARGIPIGGDLEYADEITLGRSIVSRIVYE